MLLKSEGRCEKSRLHLLKCSLRNQDSGVIFLVLDGWIHFILLNGGVIVLVSVSSMLCSINLDIYVGLLFYCC